MNVKAGLIYQEKLLRIIYRMPGSLIYGEAINKKKIKEILD
jgi:hypothetical protein